MQFGAKCKSEWTFDKALLNSTHVELITNLYIRDWVR